MECKANFLLIMIVILSQAFTQVSMGFLPTRGSTILFPRQPASRPRGIAEIAGRDIQAYPERDQQRKPGARLSTFAMSRGCPSSPPG